MTYYDIGGMGPNSNKSFVSNITGSDNYLSMEIAFSSYEGEKLGDFLKEYDHGHTIQRIVECNKLGHQIDLQTFEEFVVSFYATQNLINV